MNYLLTSRAASSLRDVCKGAAIGFVAFTVIDSFLDFVSFSGVSMEPAILDREFGVGEKVSAYGQLRRGDIVMATAPNDPSICVCKRIQALEGDKVVYDVNQADTDSSGHTIDEDRLYPVQSRRFVPRGHIWLVGDNEAASHDSRHYGPVPLALVRSRVAAKISLRGLSFVPRWPAQSS